MTLHIDILPEPQRKLWDELQSTPEQFVLYGGTAIALRLGHRQSVDFDFFSFSNIDPDQLLRTVPYLDNVEVTQLEKNTLSCTVDRAGPVKLSFFGVPRLEQISPPESAPDSPIKLASLIDLAGMKVATMQKRAAARDYLDLDALIEQAGIGLENALSAGMKIYGSQFNPLITLQAMAYYEDGDLGDIPSQVRTRLTKAASSVDLEVLSRSKG